MATNALRYVGQINGDFSVDVDVFSISGGDARLAFDTATGRVVLGRLAGSLFSVYPESTGTPTIINISTSGPLTLRIVRISRHDPNFYNSGSGFALVSSYTGATTANGSFLCVCRPNEPDFRSICNI